MKKNIAFVQLLTQLILLQIDTAWKDRFPQCGSYAETIDFRMVSARFPHGFSTVSAIAETRFVPVSKWLPQLVSATSFRNLFPLLVSAASFRNISPLLVSATSLQKVRKPRIFRFPHQPFFILASASGFACFLLYS